METNYQKTRREAFIRIAEKRVTKCLKSLESLSKLSDKKNYIYDDEQVSKIIHALKLKIDDLEKSFSIDDKEENIFKF